MAEDGVIRIGSEMTDAIRDMESLIGTFRDLKKIQGDLVVTMVKTDAANKKMSIGLRGLNEAGREVDFTLVKTKDGFKSLSASQKIMTSDMLDTSKATERMSGKIRESFSEIDMTGKEKLSLNREIESLEKYLSTSQDLKMVDMIWANLSSGHVQNYKGSILSLQNRLQSFIELQRKMKTTRMEVFDPKKAEEAQRAIDVLAGSFRKMGASNSEIKQVNDKIRALRDTVKGSSTEVRTLDRLWGEIARGKIGVYRGVQDKIQSQLISIHELQNKIKASQKEAASIKAAEVVDLAKLKQVDEELDAIARSFRNLGASSKEMKHAETQLGRIRAIAQKHKVDIKTIDRVWDEVSRGQVVIYRGHMAKIRAIAQDLALKQWQLQQATNKTSEATKKLAKNSGSVLLSWRSIVRLMLTSGIHRMMYSIVTATREAAGEAIKLKIALAEIRTIDTARVEVDKMRDSLRNLSDSYGLDILDEAEAAYQTLSNQVADGTDAISFSESATRLAIATVSESADAVNVLTATINAFGMRASEADALSAQFFKTVELGRLRLSELGNTIGRVALPANQLGVSTAELFAAIDVTTIKGVKLTESLTFIRNIMLKLIRPGADMKKLMRSWGVESGQAAIKAFGFHGVLAKIEEQTRGSSDVLGDLFQRIRAITGSLVFAGEGVNDFAAALDEIENAGPSFLRAIEDVMTNAGKILQIEGQQIRNLFLVDVADDLVEGLAHINNEVIDLSEAVRIMIGTAKQAAPALTIFGAALLGAGAIAGGPITAAVASITAAIAAILGVSAVVAHTTEKNERVRDRFEKDTESMLAAMTKSTEVFAEKTASAFDKHFSTASRAVNALAANTVAALVKESDNLVVELKDEANSLSVILKMTKQVFSETFSDAKKDVTKAVQAFNKSSDMIDKIRNSIKELKFSNAFGDLENVDEKLSLIKDTIAGLGADRKGFNLAIQMDEAREISTDILSYLSKAQSLIDQSISSNKSLLEDMMESNKDFVASRREILFENDLSNAEDLSDKIRVIDAELTKLSSERSNVSKGLSSGSTLKENQGDAVKRFQEIVKAQIEMHKERNSLINATEKSNEKSVKNQKKIRDADLKAVRDFNSKKKVIDEKIETINKRRDISRRDRGQLVFKQTQKIAKLEQDLARKRLITAGKLDEIDIQKVPEFNFAQAVKDTYASAIKEQETFQTQIQSANDGLLVQRGKIIDSLNKEIDAQRLLSVIAESRLKKAMRNKLEVAALKADLEVVASQISKFKVDDISGASTSAEVDKIMSRREQSLRDFVSLRRQIDPGYSGAGMQTRLEDERSLAGNRVNQLLVDNANKRRAAEIQFAKEKLEHLRNAARMESESVKRVRESVALFRSLSPAAVHAMTDGAISKNIDFVHVLDEVSKNLRPESLGKYLGLLDKFKVPTAVAAAAAAAADKKGADDEKGADGKTRSAAAKEAAGESWLPITPWSNITNFLTAREISARKALNEEMIAASVEVRDFNKAFRQVHAFSGWASNDGKLRAEVESIASAQILIASIEKKMKATAKYAEGAADMTRGAVETLAESLAGVEEAYKNVSKHMEEQIALTAIRTRLGVSNVLIAPPIPETGVKANIKDFTNRSQLAMVSSQHFNNPTQDITLNSNFEITTKSANDVKVVKNIHSALTRMFATGVLNPRK